MYLICVLCIILIGVERVPSESDSNEDASLQESPYNEHVDNFSDSDSDSDSEEEVDSALETTINEHDPSDHTTKSNNTNKSYGGFPAGRNDRNVKW